MADWISNEHRCERLTKNRVALTFGVRGLASPSLEIPSPAALGVGGAREFGVFGEVDGFATVGLVAVDAGIADFGSPGVLLPYFASGNWSMTESKGQSKSSEYHFVHAPQISAPLLPSSFHLQASRWRSGRVLAPIPQQTNSPRHAPRQSLPQVPSLQQGGCSINHRL